MGQLECVVDRDAFLDALLEPMATASKIKGCTLHVFAGGGPDHPSNAGQVCIGATGDINMVRSYVGEVDIIKHGGMLIEGPRLHSIIKECSDDPVITIRCDKEGVVSLHVTNGVFRLFTMPESELKSQEIATHDKEPPALSMSADTMLRYLQSAMPASSPDISSRYSTRGVHINVDPEAGRLVIAATDGMIASVRQVSASSAVTMGAPITMSVGLDGCQMLRGLLNRRADQNYMVSIWPGKQSRRGSTIHVQTCDVVVSGPKGVDRVFMLETIDGSFPPVMDLLPSPARPVTGKCVVDTDDFISALRRCRIMLENQREHVQVEVGDSALKLSAADASAGRSDVSIPASQIHGDITKPFGLKMNSVRRLMDCAIGKSLKIQRTKGNMIVIGSDDDPELSLIMNTGTIPDKK